MRKSVALRKKAETPKYPVTYPTGICVKTEVGHYYINGQYRNRLASKRVFDSWNFTRVVESSEAALKNYKKGKMLGFRDGTLVRQLSTGHFFFISQRKRSKVVNPDLLAIMGIKPADAVWVSDSEIALHEEGDELS